MNYKASISLAKPIASYTTHLSWQCCEQRSGIAARATWLLHAANVGQITGITARSIVGPVGLGPQHEKFKVY